MREPLHSLRQILEDLVVVQHSCDMGEQTRQYRDERIAADQRAIARLLDVGHLCACADSRFEECRAGILDAAIALTGAHKGNIQLLDVASGSLVLAAQRGFDKRFLSFFCERSTWESGDLRCCIRNSKAHRCRRRQAERDFSGQPRLGRAQFIPRR